jgi:TolB protein
MPALGGLPRRIAEAGNFPSWSPDGSTLIYTSGPQGSRKILTVPVIGGEPREVPVKVKSTIAQSFFYPSYSSNGRWIVFEAQQGDGIYVIPAAGGEATQIARGRRPVWNAASTGIIYSSGEPGKNYSLWQVPFSPESGTITGEPTALTVSRGRDTQAAVSRDGKLIAFAGQDVEFNIERIAFDVETGRTAGNPEIITSGHSLNYFFDVSPDRRSIVYESHRGTSFQIWRTEVDEKTPSQLTSDANFEDHFPKWSPDGRSIAFTRKGIRDDDSKQKLFLMAQDGANPQPIIDAVQNFRWTRDGLGIFYLSTADRQFHLHDLKSNTQRPLTKENGVTGQFNLSPDDQWLVYQSSLKGSNVDVRAVRTSDTTSRSVAETPMEDLHPFISPSSRWVYFQPDHKNLYRVPGPAQSWRQATPEKMTNFPESGLFLEDPQISRDGRELFYSRATVAADIWLMRLER